VLGVDLAVHDSDPSATKPIIFCLHAAGHGGSDFAAFERAFAKDYRIITVDWPGQGASGKDHVPTSAARYAQLFEALVKELNARQIIVLGNSIGATAAIQYAATHQDNMRALLLTDSGGLDENPDGLLARLFIGYVQRKMSQGARGDADFAAWFAGYYADLLITPAARQQRDAIVASGYETAPLLAEAWQSFQANTDLRPLAKSLKMPVFVGWAKHDKITRWSRSKAAVKQIPGVQIQMFECGHTPFLETPDEFNRVVAKFLARVQHEELSASK
jgi:pimeloyl-ACP methyl ester carboxylesterase